MRQWDVTAFTKNWDRLLEGDVTVAFLEVVGAHQSHRKSRVERLARAEERGEGNLPFMQSDNVGSIDIKLTRNFGNGRFWYYYHRYKEKHPDCRHHLEG